jgi:hypothetical protein
MLIKVKVYDQYKGFGLSLISYSSLLILSDTLNII